MAHIMTKRGSVDNIITYEHFCDTTADMNNINPDYITLGSTCIVLSGENSEEMEVYMANSQKKWKSIAAGVIGGSSSGGGTTMVVREVEDTNVPYTNIRLNKTWQEIHDAILEDVFVYLLIETPNSGGGINYIIGQLFELACPYDSDYGYYTATIGNSTYYAPSPNDYLMLSID